MRQKPILLSALGLIAFLALWELFPKLNVVSQSLLPAPSDLPAAFLREFLNQANKRGLDYYIMEAFDQPWKRNIEGSVGAYWGLYDAERHPKFPMVGPVAAMAQWDQAKPVSWWESTHAFIFGREWITASFWQDWYGILPLFTGSLLISFLALILAMILGFSAVLALAGACYLTAWLVMRPGGRAV